MGENKKIKSKNEVKKAIQPKTPKHGKSKIRLYII